MFDSKQYTPNYLHYEGGGNFRAFIVKFSTTNASQKHLRLSSGIAHS